MIALTVASSDKIIASQEKIIHLQDVELLRVKGQMTSRGIVERILHLISIERNRKRFNATEVASLLSVPKDGKPCSFVSVPLWELTPFFSRQVGEKVEVLLRQVQGKQFPSTRWVHDEPPLNTISVNTWLPVVGGVHRNSRELYEANRSKDGAKHSNWIRIWN
jgi:hypothetical protein